ncbi:hypothetical protein BGX29_007735 [Mortierella sp. GBA35]|nr:hypothetical protein BGX29_007735 [Mortierella sp. GBA35]
MGKKGNNNTGGKKSNNRNNNSNSTSSSNGNAKPKRAKLVVKNPFTDMADAGSPFSSTSSSVDHSMAPAVLTATGLSASQQHQQQRPVNYNSFSDNRANLFNKGAAVHSADEDEEEEEDEESVVRARRETLAALDPYNANAHKEHFKPLKVPKQRTSSHQQQQRQQQEEENAEGVDYPSSSPSATTYEGPKESLSTLTVCHDAIPVPGSLPYMLPAPTAGGAGSNGKSEYTTISLASPSMTVYSSQALGSGQPTVTATAATASINNCGATSLNRMSSLDSSFHRLKKGASDFLLGEFGFGSFRDDVKKDSQAKKSQNQEENARVRRMMNGEQDLGLDYRIGHHHDGDNDNVDDTDPSLFNHNSHAPDQRSSSTTFGSFKKATASPSPPPLLVTSTSSAFSSFPSFRGLIHSATGLSRSSTAPIGSMSLNENDTGNLSPPPFSPAAYLRRSQTTTAFGQQQGYPTSTTVASFSPPISRCKNTPVMVPTIVVPKHFPGSGASAAALSATSISFSPPLTSTSTSSSTATVMTSSDDDNDFLSKATTTTTTPTRTYFHRLSSHSSSTLTVPAKAATAANSTQLLLSLLEAEAMAAAQRARAPAAGYGSASTPALPALNRSNTSVSVDSMAGPLTGNDYIGQFERDRAQARSMGALVVGGIGSHEGHHQYKYNVGGDIEKNGNRSLGFGVGFLQQRPNTNTNSILPITFTATTTNDYYDELDDNDDLEAMHVPRDRQQSGHSDMSEKLMHLPDDPSPFEGMCSCRGFVNVTSMLLILCGLILLILGYSIASSLKKDRLAAEAAAAAANAVLADGLDKVRFAIDSQQQHQGLDQSGLMLASPLSKTGLSTVTGTVVRGAGLVDPDTPIDKRVTLSKDGKEWELVFSDEFGQDGRGFGPGQDPHWEAVNLPPSAAMGTLKHYSSDKVRTRNGQLEITFQREPSSSGGTNTQKQKRDGSTSPWKYTSGMLQSWNKMCFQGGILEVAVNFPGSPAKPGQKPRVFVLGNLARYGYPASMDGVWPFSSSTSSSSSPTTPHQCEQLAASTSTSASSSNNNSTSSSLVQRLNGCSSGADSLGRISRGAPEMTLFETHYGVQAGPTAIEAQKREIEIQQQHQQAPSAPIKRRQYNKMKCQQQQSVDQGNAEAEATVVLQKQSLGSSRVTVDTVLGGANNVNPNSNNSAAVVVESTTPQWIHPLDNRFFTSSSSSSSSSSSALNNQREEFITVSLEYWPGSTSTSSHSPTASSSAPTPIPTPDDNSYIQFSLNNQRQSPLLSYSHFLHHQSNSSQNDWYNNAKSFPPTIAVPQEPMSIVVSLGLLQEELLLDPDLSFPAVMKIDYIRLYQPRQENTDGQEGKGDNGEENKLSYDPADHPTAAYIRDHPRAYSDPGVHT